MALKEEKRARILDAAAELFATRQFHEVILSDVAEAAAVGKGTLYLYFKDKNALYSGMILRGYAKLIDKIRAGLTQCTGTPENKLRFIVREMLDYACDNPFITEILRSSTAAGIHNSEEWLAKKAEFRAILADVIRDGVRAGQFRDEHPELTANHIASLIRSINIFRPEGLDRDAVIEHATLFVMNSLTHTGDSHR